MTLYDRLEAALLKLPPSATGVAGFLVDRGITGVRDECSACPVSRWLRTELQVPIALVDIGEVTIVNELGHLITLPSTWGIRQFITRFDMGGEFPDLVDQGGMTEQESYSVAYL